MHEVDADDALIDAALACFADHGSRKTSLSDVARRAGVSRTTAYRVFGSKPGLIEAVSRREVARFLAALEDALAREPSWAAAVAFTLDHVRSHAALQRAVREEPEDLLRVLTVGVEGSSALAVLADAAAGIIDRRLDDGELRVSPREAAEWTVHAIFSLLLAPTSTTQDPDRVTDLILHGVVRYRAAHDG